ncbi:MAG: hypothetical protein F6K54_18215 [Okeania sp. SIO3B5]|uniref:DUF6232 family protein n=1 Tax=Okeania sp. SIO3B5 TaxID=2607811 RepID=UPI001400C5C4|nr:DUF6232 family protein [Okeania sp. SIO3B5]NEO54844.1 hypothetical protein [Okeania sp. SIO3B5]
MKLNLRVNDNLPKSSPESEEVDLSFLKVRGKTLVYNNTIYQISNISSISLVERKKAKKRTKIYSASLFIGVVLLAPISIILLSYPNMNLQIFGLLMIVIDILVLPRYILNITYKEYGMIIRGNSGDKQTLFSPDKEGIIKVILKLCEIMNTEEITSVNVYSQDNRIKLEDKSIQVGTSIASSFVPGKVGGNVVSSIN